MQKKKIIRNIAIVLSLVQLTGCSLTSNESPSNENNNHTIVTEGKTDTSKYENVDIEDSSNSSIVESLNQNNGNGLTIQSLVAGNFQSYESQSKIEIPKTYQYDDKIQIFPAQVVSWNTKLALPQDDSGQKWHYDIDTDFTGYMGMDPYSPTESSITIEELYNNTRGKTCEEFGWDINEDKGQFSFYICMENEDKSIRYVFPVTIADMTTEAQPLMGYNKLLTFTEDVEYFVLNPSQKLDYWEKDLNYYGDKLNYYKHTQKSVSGADFGVFVSSTQSKKLNAGDPVYMALDSEGELMAGYTGDCLARDIKDGSLIFYRTVEGDKKGTWEYIDLTQYQPYIIDECKWNEEDAPKDVSIKSAETIPDILNCFPRVIDVVYCDGSVRTEIAHYNFFDKEEGVYHLCAPGDASINGVVNEGYSIEFYCDNSSSFMSGVGAFEYYEFSPNLSEEEVIAALDELQARQEFLGAKTGGLLNTQTISYGSKILNNINLYALTQSESKLTENDAPSNPEEMDYTTTFETEESQPEETTVNSEETEPVIETTVPSETEEITTTTNQEDSSGQKEEHLTDIPYELGKPIYVDTSFGTIRINGDDPAQLKIAANMLDYQEEFLIPVEDYLAPYQSQYDLIYAALYANVQNPYTPTIANINCEAVEEDNKNYLKYSIEYGESKEYTEKWAPEIYKEVKNIAAEINSKNYSTDREKFEAINEAITSRAEYNSAALEACSDGMVQTVLTLPEEYQSAWSAYGVLCQGEGVCQSYAEAYKLIADELGLECISVTGKLSGGGHIWNKVCIDGQWYIMDSTNNDGTDNDEMKQAISNAYCFASDADTETMLVQDDNHWCLDYNKNNFAATDNSLNYWVIKNKCFDSKNFLEQYEKSGKIWAGYCNEQGINSVEDFIAEIVVPCIKSGDLDVDEFSTKKVGSINNIYILFD